MKIHAGQYKGRNFYRPEGIRPTQSIVTKSLFDMLGQDLDGIMFLDLFAGSGSVGLEALSRGARHCTFVEKDPKCAAVIRQNVELLDIENYSLLNSDAFATIKHLSSRQETYDVVYIDPPYGRDLAKKSLKTLMAYDILQPASLVILKHEKQEVLPPQAGRLKQIRSKRYGGTLLSIYQIVEGDS